MPCMACNTGLLVIKLLTVYIPGTSPVGGKNVPVYTASVNQSPFVFLCNWLFFVYFLLFSRTFKKTTF